MTITQLDAARAGTITEAMKNVAEKEHIDAETLRKRIAKGTVAIPCNIHHTALSPEGVGEGLRTKVNVNLGVSLALDPVKPREYFESAPPSNEGTCTMCGKMCAMRTVNNIMDGLTIDLGDEND